MRPKTLLTFEIPDHKGERLHPRLRAEEAMCSQNQILINLLNPHDELAVQTQAL